MLFSECIKYVEGVAEKALADCDPKPFVSIGGSTTGKPFEFIVRELPESVNIGDRSTATTMGMGARGCYRVEFSIACQAWAKRKGVDKASETVLGWAERFIAAIAADRTLGGLAIHAEPFVSQGGTAYENDRALYLAAIDLGVRVKAEIDPLTIN